MNAFFILHLSNTLPGRREDLQTNIYFFVSARILFEVETAVSGQRRNVPRWFEKDVELTLLSVTLSCVTCICRPLSPTNRTFDQTIM